MPSADVRFKDRQPRNHRWLRALNLLALSAALVSTLVARSASGFPHDPRDWFWTALFELLPAVGIGGLAFFALARLRGRIAAWCCGVFGTLASGFWVYAYRDFMHSSDPNVGLAMALLPIVMMPFWAVMIVVVIVLEWWSLRTSRAAR
ncbi:MAG: hypothetical protein ABL934_05880 [Lysobacteraceae bacterium]